MASSKEQGGGGGGDGEAMKILMVSENVPPQINGIARRVHHYGESLKKLGHDVTLVSPHSNDVCWKYTNIFNQGNDFIVLKPSFLWKCLTMENAYDVVHCVMPLNVNTFFLMSAFRIRSLLFPSRRRPHLVCSWHCNLIMYSGGFFPGLLKPCILALTVTPFRILRHLADRMLVPTLSTEPDLLGAFPAHTVDICATGIEVKQFNPRFRNSKSGLLWQRRKQEDLKRFGNKSKLLLYVGRVSVEKGLNEIVEAMRTSLKDDCVLWIVGDGPIRQSVEKTCAENDLPVVFWGFQTGDMLQTVYTVCDLFVTASTTETFGQTINEALASGVMVAIPRSPGFKDAYSHVLDPDMHMWTPNDLKDMVRTIRGVLSEGKIIDRSQLHNWDQAAEHLADQYSRDYRNETVVGLLHAMSWIWVWCMVVIVVTFAAQALSACIKRIGLHRFYPSPGIATKTKRH